MKNNVLVLGRGWMNAIKVVFCLGILSMALPAGAVEYFVDKEGNDANNGRGRQTAFLTIQKGVDALTPGDTLTIGPGEYFESVKRADLGSPDADTVIRAEIPGTALLRGDVPVPPFRGVAGRRFVYVADFDRDEDVQAVNELDTLTVYGRSPNMMELDFSPGRWTALYFPFTRATCDLTGYISKIYPWVHGREALSAFSAAKTFG